MTYDELIEHLKIDNLEKVEQEDILLMLEEVIAERIYAKVAEVAGGQENEEQIASIINPGLVKKVASSVVSEFRLVL